jgi:hypothetical protein
MSDSDEPLAAGVSEWTVHSLTLAATSEEEA